MPMPVSRTSMPIADRKSTRLNSSHSPQPALPLGPAVTPADGRIRLTERREEARHPIGSNADAGIADFDADCVRRLVLSLNGGRQHDLAGLRKLKRVRD